MAKTLTKLFVAAAGALVGAAVAQELNKPPAERTWHGQLGGIPYDFRPPTADRLRRAVWDPENPQLFPPHAFGMGWSVNFARLSALVAGEPEQPAPADPAGHSGEEPA